VNEIRALINAKAHFAVLTPLTLLPEIASLENDNEGNVCYDSRVAADVNKLCKVIFASTGQCWLISCPGMTTESTILLAEQSSQLQNCNQQDIVGRTIYLAKPEEGCSQEECLRIAQDSEESFRELIHDHWDWEDHNVDVLVQTRAQAELKKAESNDVGGVLLTLSKSTLLAIRMMKKVPLLRQQKRPKKK